MHESEQEPEQQLEDLQAQADSLGDRIEEAKDDWEEKKLDPDVPGAGGDPKAAEAEDAEATAYPAKGSSEELTEDRDGDA